MHWLVCVIETGCVYCAVCTKYLFSENRVDVNFHLWRNKQPRLHNLSVASGCDGNTLLCCLAVPVLPLLWHATQWSYSSYRKYTLHKKLLISASLVVGFNLPSYCGLMSPGYLFSAIELILMRFTTHNLINNVSHIASIYKYKTNIINYHYCTLCFYFEGFI